MELLAVFLIAVGLAMDAFAVSLCKGLAMGKPDTRQMLIVGAWFGGFQALMPVIGYYLGTSFYSYITDFDHWIAAGLLWLIGLNMIRESLSSEEEQMDASLGFRTMLVLAVATSIDALAVGISLAMEGGGIAYYKDYTQTYLEGSNGLCELVPLANKKDSKYIHLSTRKNMMVGVNQTIPGEEKIEIMRLHPVLLDFYVSLFFGCQFESLDPTDIYVAQLAASAQGGGTDGGEDDEETGA